MERVLNLSEIGFERAAEPARDRFYHVRDHRVIIQ